MPVSEIINTTRLQLRLPRLSDAVDIQICAEEFQIADTMISIPHPYPDGEANRYIQHCLQEYKQKTAICFVILEKQQKQFCGILELRAIDMEHQQAEISFWIRSSQWGKGFMTEVLQVAISFGFEQLGLNRLYAYHMTRNPASGRVLEKNGFVQEGVLRQRVRKWGDYEDVAIWAILKRDSLRSEKNIDLNGLFDINIRI